MEAKGCSESNCELEVESVFLKPCERTKKAILDFLEKEKARKEKIKRKILSLFSQNLSNSENSFEDLIYELDSDLTDINDWCIEISEAQKVSKLNQDPILELLPLQPEEAIDKLTSFFQENPDPYCNVKVFYGLTEEIEKMIEDFIKNKFEAILDKRLFNIEKNLEEHNKAISSKNTELEEVKSFIPSLKESIEKNQGEIETWKEIFDSNLEAIETKNQREIDTWKKILDSNLEAIESKNQREIDTWKKILDSNLEAIESKNRREIETWKKKTLF